MSKMKFEFQGVISSGAFYDRESKKCVVMELNDDNLTIAEVLNEFQNFLRAAGYYFPEGAELDIVEDEDDSKDNWTTDDWDGLPGTSDEDLDDISLDSEKPGKYNFSDEEITAEVIRIRDSTPGLSEEAYEMAAWHNLSKKADGEV